MTRSGWLALCAAAGAAILGLSLVDAWIVHHRELRGEGYREVLTVVDAWRSVARPVLSLGVIVGVATAAVALVSIRAGRGAPAWTMPVGSVLTLSLLCAVLVPIAQDGHASSIDLAPGWAAFAGAGLAATMVIAAVRVARPGPRHSVALAGLVLVMAAGGAGARWVALQVAAAPSEAWSIGSYTRAAVDGQGTETLTVGDGRFEIADRWTGRWESHSWTVILVDDAACPDARGTYHAHNVGPDGEDLRFVKVVDTCDDGARAADLETGIWERDP